MRNLLIILAIVAGICGSTLSYAQDGQELERTITRSSVNDEAKFVTIKDEYGNEHYIKTIALVKISEDGLDLDLGEPISPKQDKVTVPEDKSILFE